jgi:hypothetical protein
MNETLQWLIGISATLVTLAIIFSIVAPFFLPRGAETLAAG